MSQADFAVIISVDGMTELTTLVNFTVVLLIDEITELTILSADTLGEQWTLSDQLCQ